MPGKVLRFPLRRRRPRGSSKIKNSPLFRIMMGNRHLWGTQPRSLHFSNALLLTPNSRANNASTFQSGRSGSMRRQLALGLDIDQLLSDLPSDVQQLFSGRWKALINGTLFVLSENSDMNEMADIRRRVKMALRAYRDSRGWTQLQMADFLHIPLNNYESYETKEERNIPTDIIARFCRYTDNDPSWLLLGTKSTRQNTRRLSDKRKPKPPEPNHA